MIVMRRSKVMASVFKYGIWFLSCGISTMIAKADDAQTSPANDCWLSSLDLSKMRQDYGKAQLDRSIDQHPISIGGISFKHGVGTHANSLLYVDLHKKAQHFTASVGVDDDAGGQSARVRFKIYGGDNKLLWKSPAMKTGQPPLAVDLDVRGIDKLLLVASAAGDGIAFDHADWADAKVTYREQAPTALDLPESDPGILTPPSGDMPRINGPDVFGVRPKSPFLYTVPVSGKGPFQISADNLPAQLSLDPQTGQITGSLPGVGKYEVVFHAKNAVGIAKKRFQIIVGNQIRLTPPMGWNSWNCWGDSVSREKVVISAKAMVSTGLIQHGWTYINIDDGWQGIRGGEVNGIQPNKKFPDMKALADQIHSMGLHFGIYSTPWQGSYASYIGSSCDNADGTYDWIKAGEHNEFFKYQEKANDSNHHGGYGKFSFVEPDVKQWAAWGVDYLKYDWRPIDVAHVQPMSEALEKSGRDIVFSLSNSASITHGADWARLSNCWRTSDDIFDNWPSMIGEALYTAKWSAFVGPGHFNDPDMLVVGRVGWGNPHPSGLTRDEQYTHISFWSLLSAPLLIGCDMGKLDDFTLNLLTNDEVLAIDQDSLCQAPNIVRDDEDQKVVIKKLADGALALGLFNLGPLPAKMSVQFKDLNLSGTQSARDLWKQKGLGTFDRAIEANVDSHGVVFLKLSPSASK